MGTETEDGDAKITEDAIQSRIQGTGSTSMARKWAVSKSRRKESVTAEGNIEILGQGLLIKASCLS
jgi:hypothetical protein